MATPETDPLWFISFDALLKIVFDDKLWPLFECYLTTKELLQAKFTEIGPIRNRVAHCRSLHDDDLDRLRRILRDLDHGFWTFCTSYNDTFPIVGDERIDEFYKHFENRMGFNYAQSGPNSWALVGNTIGMSTTVMIERAIRLGASRAEALVAGKGMIYHFTISLTANNQRFMDYQRILERTEERHSSVVHIILDSFQRSLRVTFPALTDPAVVVESAERFLEASSNSFTYSWRDALEKRIDRSEESSADSSMREYDLYNEPFERLAARWPHYVVPPSHPYAVLDPSCPCTIFEA